jgi:hypothetical protein
MYNSTSTQKYQPGFQQQFLATSNMITTKELDLRTAKSYTCFCPKKMRRISISRIEEFELKFEQTIN